MFFGLSKMPINGLYISLPKYIILYTLGPSSDPGCLNMWSLGCVIVEMITGEPPWESAMDLEDLAMKIALSGDSPKYTRRYVKGRERFLDEVLC